MTASRGDGFAGGSAAIRVVVADDQQIVREGLSAVLGMLDDIRVVGEAADGERAVALTAEQHPDVVLMDLRMPVLDGVAATARIRREHPDIAVVVLTTYVDDASIAGALRAGARSYLTKHAGREQTAAAVRAAAAGQSTFDAPVSDRLVAAMARDGEPTSERGDGVGASPPPPDGLTAREADVLRLIARGLSNADIARELFIAETTVKTHINNAFAKIGSRNRTEAAAYVHRRGLAAGPHDRADPPVGPPEQNS